MKVIEILRISPEKEIINNYVSKHVGVAYLIEAAYTAEKVAQHDIDPRCIDNILR